MILMKKIRYYTFYKENHNISKKLKWVLAYWINQDFICSCGRVKSDFKHPDLFRYINFGFQDLSDVQKPNVDKPRTPPEIVEHPATPEMYVEKENNDITMVQSPEDIRQEES